MPITMAISSALTRTDTPSVTTVCGSVAVARELTKLHEEVVRGRLSELAAVLESRGGQLVGEPPVPVLQLPHRADQTQRRQVVPIAELGQQPAGHAGLDQGVAACRSGWYVAPCVA